MHRYKELDVWKKSMDLSFLIYELTKEFPSEEKFGLISQMRRCSVSIASNIAEGAGRNSNKEFKHFLSIANGSNYELQTQLILLIELNLINKEKVQPIIEQCIEIQKMNYSFQQKL